MGLDTTHNCWHGGYGSFNMFRHLLAEQIDINLDEYNGYGADNGKDLTTIKHDIMPLLNHSDCDGRLTLKESKRIIKGLDNILENFKIDPKFDDYFKSKIIQFRDGCSDAVNKKQMIKFQ